MSIKTFQIVESMDFKALDTQLALQCAPVLTGIKISNLLNLDCLYSDTILQRFEKTSLDSYILYSSKEKVTFLIYSKEALKDYLKIPKVKEFMNTLGYFVFEIEDILKEFSKRYKDYREKGGNFPHEMGLLLGYPVEDVKGFIKNEGKKFLYNGYWKVYKNVLETLKIFQSYDQVREIALKIVKEKKDVLELLNLNYTKLSRKSL